MSDGHITDRHDKYLNGSGSFLAGSDHFLKNRIIVLHPIFEEPVQVPLKNEKHGT